MKRLDTGSYLMGNAFDYAAGLQPMPEPNNPRYLNELLPLREMSVREIAAIYGVVLICCISICAVSGSPSLILTTMFLTWLFNGLLPSCRTDSTEPADQRTIMAQRPHGNAQFASADELRKAGFIE